MAFSYSVQLSDPNDSGGQLDALLVTDLEAALADWSRLIDGLGTLVLALDVAPTMFGTAQGGATEDVPDGYTSSGATLTEASSVYELTTGQHVAGQTSDITITVDPSYAAKLFLNPDPGDGAPSPPDEVDAVSIFRHELMHGFGMNGYYDGTGKAVDGIGPGGGVFTKFDTLIQMNPDGTADFVGSNAEKIFGGPVPLTTDVAPENYYHFAEATTAPNGQDLMNGQALNDGIDYPISTLDVAVLKDIGVPVTATASDLAVYDTLTDEAVAATDTGYVGPVGGLQEQYVNVTQADLDISVSSPGWFIHSGSGTDAIAASSGANVIDGGTGSNFLSGGSGTDTFFVDTRDAAYDIWSTVDGFHAGDNVTLWGITQSGFDLTWGDGQGASGFTGLTLHATADGHPEASLTLSGYTTANIGDGSLGISFDTDPASGSPYMSIHANT